MGASANVTIVSVLRSGGEYGVEYVERLAEGVYKHSGKRLICFSDVKLGDYAIRLPLRHNWPGWWSKIEIFRYRGPAVYFDLDTIIQGDIRPLLGGHRFTMLRCFLGQDKPTSGVMAWSGDYSHLAREFAKDPGKHIVNHKSRHSWGDQGFIAKYLGFEPDYWQDRHPGMIVSRKAHRDRSKASVVCYHGRPRPAETGWAP